MAQLSIEERLAAIEKKAQKALDYQAVQNVMSMHTYYHNTGKQGEEYDLIWAKDPGVKWTIGGGIYEGQEAVRILAVESFHQRHLEYLENLTKFYPVEVDMKNLFAGEIACHPQTTPVIEIAGDGKTAKGAWYSPGVVAGVRPDGKPHAMWMWEMYGVDFIKEDGQWKIWHLVNWYDFIIDMGKDFSDVQWNRKRGFRPMKFAQETMKQPGGDPSISYNPTRVPWLPPLPKPYETWKDTFSY
jgi:hypothetical protein